MSRHSEVTAEALAAQPSDSLAEALYYLPDQMALLNSAGQIVFVNSAWMRFAAENGGNPEKAGIGRRYLDVCGPEPLRDDGVKGRPSVGSQLASLLQGKIDSFSEEYPCHSPTTERWFLMRATKIKRGGAIVVHSDITARKRAELDLLEQATRDPLTKLLNRRGLSTRLAAELSRLRRDGHPCSALLLDCDNFKGINDRHGYTAGDVVLTRIATNLRDNLRPEDVVARIGGDEFLVILPNSNVSGACAIAERLRSAIYDEPLDAALGALKVSVSISAASLNDQIVSLDGVLERCQSALRVSKAAGKNRTTSLDTPTPFREERQLLQVSQAAVLTKGIFDVQHGAPVAFELVCEGQPGSAESGDALLGASSTARELQDLDAACFQKCLAAVQSDNKSLKHLHISPLTLLALGPDVVVSWIPQHLEPSSLCINFAETQILGPPPELTAAIRSLKAAGFRIGVTNVGFGRNALENLIVLEPDSIMLHSRFGSNLESDFGKTRVLERLIRVASSLSIEVIVTQVCTKDDLRIINNLLATLAQGPAFDIAASK